eukprot:TRINITY_DN10201_c0_g1_i1.p1 TRINITY_DN10201_c0_g1~~TRINITY_DN10201_c0_g1_i1.p1  ORF type:complete len:563 (+),score=180.20 TRINITY_DN10201_c0_g1_i1:56-1690(+)
MKALIFLIFAISTISCAKIKVSPQVNTKYGTVMGQVASNAVVWRGIPFAEAPIGNLRWNSTRAPKSWSGVLDATRYSPACPQSCTLPPIFCPNVTNEDCLYMNIYSPLTRTSGKLLPVMLFIFGGAFIQGDASCPIYRGEWNANATEIIYVNFNYRLGALGFLTLGKHLVGNYGLDDQRMAMKFVKENIAAFGGDPDQVTLYGESAGAVSVGAHLISPLSKGYFHKAVMESNPIAIPSKSVYQANQVGSWFAGKVGCKADDMKCFRSLPVDQIVKVAQGQPFPNPLNVSVEVILQWDVTLDPLQAPMQLIDAFKAGKYNQMPIIIGTNSEEAVLFVYYILTSRFVNLEYDLLLTSLFGFSKGRKVLSMYPTTWNPIADDREVMARLFTDYLFVCPTRKLADFASARNTTYLYQFDHALSFNQYGPNYQACVGRVCHGAELPFVFHAADQDGVDFTKEEEILSREMMLYWANFAISGDTNVGSKIPVGVKWPKYEKKDMKSIRLTTPIRTEASLRKKYCDFWDGLDMYRSLAVLMNQLAEKKLLL